MIGCLAFQFKFLSSCRVNILLLIFIVRYCIVSGAGLGLLTSLHLLLYEYIIILIIICMYVLYKVVICCNIMVDYV